ncbi:unnamed protein product [Spirodela intermedia]|uniref:Uncharacterized protein n=1 Tax=Spirodela intermedia TaxID=51605 RepID=A0A7I8L0M0_SPIIN|nr:unnamed protein product [Spirodela intermedia]
MCDSVYLVQSFTMYQSRYYLINGF